MMNMENNFPIAAKVISKISVISIVLFAFFPLLASAQYYNYYDYNYYASPIYVTTGSATNISTEGAILNGSVSGTGYYSTYAQGAWFEYGTTPSLGYSTPKGSYSSGYTNFSASLVALNPGTTYYFRAVAQGPQGNMVYGSTNTFQTNFPPFYPTYPTDLYNPQPLTLTAITRPATSIGSRSVDLNASILTPAGRSSSTWFEWGTNYTLANQTPIVTVGTLPAVKHVSTITKLAPSTTYYFRAVAITSNGRVNGSILSFTTKAAAAPKETTAPATEKDTIEKVDLKSALGANAVFAGNFLPDSLLEWIIVIILVLILVTLGRYLLKR